MEILKNSKINAFFVGFIIMAIILCFSSQVKASQDGDYTYTISNDKAEITGYTGAGGAVTIPSTLGGLTVTDIGDRAFWDCDRLTSITIPEGVTNIGSYAFFSCEGLTSITIPQGVTRIGEYAFSQCNVSSITIPQRVTSISGNAFAACTNLTAIIVAEDNLTYASNNGVLFNKAGNTLIACPGGLTNIVIPQEVTSIDKYAFYGCRGLTSIAIPQGVNDIGEYAFYDCGGLTSITIPSGVTSIARYTFSYTGLTSITIPPGVSSIGDYAFFACEDLTSITIPEGVASIGEHAFTSCKGLSSIAIPSGVTSISRGTFSLCTGLTSITIPSGVTIIGNYAFQECSKITGITIPEGVTSIGIRAFNGCSDLTSITFNSATTTVFDNADTIPEATMIIGYDQSAAKDYATKYGRTFRVIQCQEGDYNYTVTDGKAEITRYTGTGGAVTIPNTIDGVNVTSIGDYSFTAAPITSIIIPEGVTSIGQNAFFGCRGLANITIPEGVTTIGDLAFAQCEGLTNINIPREVTSIAGNAFSMCPELTAITVDNGNLKYMSNNGVLFNKDGNILVLCPAGLTNIVIPQEVTTIGDYAFAWCDKLSSITLPQGVTKIGDSAFFWCKGLTSITIPEGVTSIGIRAFAVCSALNDFTVAGNNLTFASINGVLFDKTGTSLIMCPGGLTDIVIPQEVTSISDWAFIGCDKLTSIIIPPGVTNIGEDAFCECTSLTNITFNSEKTTIYDTEDTIPAETKIIGYDPSTAKEYAVKYSRTFQILSSHNGGGSHGGSVGSSSSAAANGVDIHVNGETLNEGIMTITQDGTKTIATVTFDEKKLEQKLTQSGNNPVITIPVNTEADAVIGELNGQMIKNMEYKQAVTELKTPKASYTLSPQQINIDAVAAQLGTKVELKDIKVQIQISKPNTEMLKVVEDSAKDGGFTIVVPAVEFSVKCTCGDKTIELSRFNSYVKRTVTIPAGVDPDKITTAVVVEQDGTVSHVPTQIIQIGDQYYAQINSLTNSTYSVIWHAIEFKDVDKHWAKKEISDMGSRMVVSGVNKGYYEPDRDITRAEFAAVIVRALGLKPANEQGTFSDVHGSDWFNGAIKTASQYKIISGYGNGKFGPTDKITREQAMIMIAKAMNITGLKAGFQEEDAEMILAGFADAGKTAEYARSSITTCVKTGIITGKGGNMVAPKDNITRAEVAVIVQKLLQKSEFI